MADNLIVPQVHVQRQFVVHAIYVERRHIAGNALKRLVNSQFTQKQIGINSPHIARFFIFVMLGLAFDPGYFAALVGVRIGKDNSRIHADFGVEPTVAVRRKFLVIFQKQVNIAKQILFPFARLRLSLLPGVETVSPDVHRFAQQLDRKFSGQFQDYFVFFLSYRVTVPSPFTS